MGSRTEEPSPIGVKTTGKQHPWAAAVLPWGGCAHQAG